MKDFNKYFIVGTNSDALHDTMNGTVTGELIRCRDCRYYTGKWCKRDSIQVADLNDRMVSGNDYCSRADRKPPHVNPEMVKALLDRIEKQKR